MNRSTSIATILAVIAIQSFAQVPHTINWQGYLTDGDGPLSGSVDLVISLYTEESGGTFLYQLNAPGVDADNGVVNVALGPFDGVSLDSPAYVGVAVGGGAELAPRTPLHSVPYALSVFGLRAEAADDGTNQGVNVLAGAANNTIADGVVGGTISGGGGTASSTPVPNAVTANFGTVGGGNGNTAGGNFGTVGGGRGNSASDDWATVGGGLSNAASGVFATVAGGSSNIANADHATVGGGLSNAASSVIATVGGGQSNVAGDEAATVGGGFNNAASGYRATIGGGSSNTASLDHATVGGGYNNKAQGQNSTVGGGSSNIANADYAAVAGGYLNTAGGTYSFAAGRRAKALHDGVFVWADETDADFQSSANNQFLIRASGNVGINNTAPAHPIQIGTGGAGNGNGAHVTAGGVWTNGSSRTFKENLRHVSAGEVLERVATLPIYRWEYIGSEEGDHLGPVAEDFYEAFGLGNDERYISGVDGDGVALAAIQGLFQRLVESERRNAELTGRLAELETLVLSMAEAR